MAHEAFALNSHGDTMTKNMAVLFTLYTLVGVCLFGGAEVCAEELFSPYNAETLVEITDGMYEVALSDVDEAQVAMTLLEASVKLGANSGDIVEELIAFSVLFPDNDYADTLAGAFKDYVADDSDLGILRTIVNYGLDQLDSREERQDYLKKTLRLVEKKNTAFASVLMTQIATLDLEKGEVEAAKTRLIKAYDLNPYNKIAFERLESIFADSDQMLSVVVYADYFRREVVRDPLNIEAVLLFAGYAERLELYDVASRSYEYAVGLYRYLYPDQVVPTSIYVPWAMACYNTRYSQSKCFAIAAEVRSNGVFDIVLEGICGSLAKKTGDLAQSRQAAIAGLKAEELLDNNSSEGSLTAEQVSWFYIFAFPDNDKALAWANRAYSLDAKSESVKSILGYAFVLNENYDLAEDLVGDIEEKDQIALVATALIKQYKGEDADVIEMLKLAVRMDPGSLAAERARGILESLGSEHIAEVLVENVLGELKKSFGEKVIGEFRPVENMMSVKLGLGGADFVYGSSIDAVLTLTNNSSEPIVISESSIVKGRIRIDVELSGDINQVVRELVVKTIEPSEAIMPGETLLLDFELMRGELKDILVRHPQANVEMAFTVYLDPLDDGGGVRNAVGYFEPLRKSIVRRGVNASHETLIRELGYLSTGQIKQRVRSGELFAGLLMEHYEKASGELSYEALDVALPLLTSAIRKSLKDEDWTVRMQTMASLLPMQHQMEFSFVRQISESLYDDQWPVRMMAIYLLSRTQGDGFRQVLEGKSEDDPEAIVRQFAEGVRNLNFGERSDSDSNLGDEMDPKTQELVDVLLKM
jgi:tetratricopeptide (TPR) repeat protein